MRTPDPPEKLKKGRAAAIEFIPILRNKLVSRDGSVPAGTILSAAAWLTGASLYRSFHPKDELPLLCSFQLHSTTTKEIDPYGAAGIVAQGIIEAAKTVPPPLKSASR